MDEKTMRTLADMKSTFNQVYDIAFRAVSDIDEPAPADLVVYSNPINRINRRLKSPKKAWYRFSMRGWRN